MRNEFDLGGTVRDALEALVNVSVNLLVKWWLKNGVEEEKKVVEMVDGR